MAVEVSYVEGSTLPDLEVWWPDPDGSGDLVDFSTGYTFSVVVGRRSAVEFTKSSGLTGAAGSGDGSEPADVPNLTVQWSASDLGALTPGLYTLELVATRDGDSRVRRRQARLRIERSVA